MGSLYLVRHGQASFGAHDYDQLSPLGERQSRLLGEHFREHRLHFDCVMTGSLQRHTETLQQIDQGMGVEHSAVLWPGLNEYDSDALLATQSWVPTQQLDSVLGRQAYFRCLRDGLRAWARGDTQPKGMPSYAEFVAGVTSALAHVCAHGQANVLIVSSGGPISTAVAHVLGASPDVAIELNLRMRNTSVTEMAFNPKRCTLISFNHLPHLSSGQAANWITYA